MKLCFSARGLSVSCGGVRQFIQSLVPALAQTRGDDELFVTYNREDQMGLAPDCTEIYLPGQNRLWWDFVVLPRTLRKLGIDATIFPKHLVPFGGRYSKYVVIHDLAYYVKELKAYPLLDTAYMHMMLPSSLQRARGIFAVSKHTKKDLVHYLSCDPVKITVTYEAADPKYQPIKDEALLRQVQAKYGLPSAFITFTGSLSPRKNVNRLLHALSTIKDKIPHQLVLTGAKSCRDSRVDQTIERLGLQQRVHKLGFVDEQDMAALYNLADLYVYPSLYEGFGLPVLEAMQCGCPVVASQATSIPEVAGEGALLFDPRNIAAMADVLYHVLSEKSIRDRLKEQGLKQAQQFSWIKCAESMWQRIRADHEYS